MYQKIRNHPTTRTLYAQGLIAEGVVTAAQERELIEDYRAALDSGQHVAKSLVTEPDTKLYVDWRPYLGHATTATADTRLELARLQEVGARMCAVPDAFVLQRQVQKIYEDRA